MRLRSDVLGLVLTLLGSGCAREQPAARAEASPAAGGERTSPNADQQSVRALGPHATFADLVRLARSLAGGAGRDSRAGCLLERTDGSGYVLAADLMLALERMPDPPTDLAALLERDARPIAMLTAFGTLGARTSDRGLALASFTSTAPSAQHAVLLALDHDRAFVRTSDAGASDAASEPMTSAAARAVSLASDATLFVSASAHTPVSALHALLAQLPASQRVALAVLLPADTALPSASASSELGPEVACPGGLPEVAPDAPLGDLDPSALRPALEGLQAEIAPCLGAMQVEAARVVLALRIGPEGGVAHGCLLEPAGLDARTASCVVLAARSLNVGTPNPAGFVDLHLPLALHAEGPAPQRALCR